jgi:hypothetical protein
MAFNVLAPPAPLKVSQATLLDFMLTSSTLNTGAFEFATFLFCAYLTAIIEMSSSASGTSLPGHAGACLPCWTMYQSSRPIFLRLGWRSGGCHPTTCVCEESGRLSEGKFAQRFRLTCRFSKHLYMDFYWVSLLNRDR